MTTTPFSKLVKTMSADRVLTILIVLILSAHLYLTQAVVQFSFSTSELPISEGEDLPSQLSILKTGQNEADISFQVIVMPGTAQEGTDYVPNSGDPYVFTRDTRQLPIRTQLVQNRAGEGIESFMICLPDAQVLQPMGAEAVEPRCVTITIIDDDSVVIGFKNSLETVMEGGTKSVCAVVKPDGLMLDPFDRVPLTVRTDPAGTEVVLSTSSLVFQMTNERCVTVSVPESNRRGSRSYQLVIDPPSPGSSSVPVLVYPSTIPIIVIDNDGSDAYFTIISPQPVITVLEGQRINSIRVLKLNNTVLNYNVPLVLTPLTSTEDVTIPNSLLFTPSTTEMRVEVEVMEDSMSEQRKEYNISIGVPEAIEAPNANLTTVLGDPVTIIVYDNDFKVGFTVDNLVITLAESTNGMICVEILELEPSDIDRNINIPLQLLPKNTTSGSLKLLVSEVILNATNITGCFIFDDNECEKNFAVQLSWIRPNNPDYSVSIERENVTISTQDCPTPSNTTTIVAIVIPIMAVLLIIAIIASVFGLIKLSRIMVNPTSPPTYYTGINTTTMDEVGEYESIKPLSSKPPHAEMVTVEKGENKIPETVKSNSKNVLLENGTIDTPKAETSPKGDSEVSSIHDYEPVEQGYESETKENDDQGSSIDPSKNNYVKDHNDGNDNGQTGEQDDILSYQTESTQ